MYCNWKTNSGKPQGCTVWQICNNCNEKTVRATNDFDNVTRPTTLWPKSSVVVSVLEQSRMDLMSLYILKVWIFFHLFIIKVQKCLNRVIKNKFYRIKLPFSKPQVKLNRSYFWDTSVWAGIDRWSWIQENWTVYDKPLACCQSVQHTNLLFVSLIYWLLL